METQYNKEASGHSVHTTRKTLGRIVDLAEDRKSGIFLSPTRGLVAYDVGTDEFQNIDARDPRVARLPFVPKDRCHAIFGDVYLLLSLMERSGFLGVLRQVFKETADYERLLLHVVHSFLQDGGSKKCGTFLQQSVLSFILPDIAPSTLRSDYRYFALMGKDETRSAFFKAFVRWMSSRDLSFGKGCYVDSTPLPNDIRNNPYNHLRCQGSQGCSEQTRLSLVLDDASGLPIWYSVIPGNLMDMNTLTTITNDVRSTLGIDTASYVLDAGYVSKTVIGHFGEHSDKTLIARMPHRKGYPYAELYRKCGL
ncbi:MAG: hypothetical protein HDQ87_01415 [Clostridia bacterium]|nr:hypothetical protein [Clostridia bacterium]